jgi:DNA end-binding protein Ku
MARPIWTGVISFGLLNIPVQLMTGERKSDLHFRMLDCRNNAPVRYERVNAETGKEVPWNDVCKAYEYEKGNFVLVDKEQIKEAHGGKESVDIEAFVDIADIDQRYFEKPYVLVPGKKADKGYVLLRDTLRDTGRVGIARVVIRTREYLSALVPIGDALVLLLMRYPQELVDLDDYKLPSASSVRINKSEADMAQQLIKSMSGTWDPSQYKDEFRERMQAVIEKQMKDEGVVSTETEEGTVPENAATNVVDFMSLLKKSIAENKRQPAAAKKTTSSKGKAAKKAPAKKAAARKTPAKKATKRTTKKTPAKRRKTG